MSRILISGASGLIGSALIPSLESHGFEITRLVRQQPRNINELHWDPILPIPPDLVSGFNAIVHLAGESVTDFDAYRVDPSQPLSPDFFVPDSSKPPPGVSLAAKV